MAYEFTSASSQYLEINTTIFKSQNKITLVGWVWRNASGSWQIIGPAKAASSRLYIAPASDNNTYVGVENGSGTYGTTGNVEAIQQWSHLAMVFDGTQTGNANRLKYFTNGTQKTLSFVGTIPSSTSSDANVETFHINRLQNASIIGNGRYAEVGVWHAALTAAEIASLAKGMTCDKVRPQSLVFSAPLVRELIDQKGGLTITNNNGATVANHPRIYP
jgi:hypothetical protein